MKVQLTAFRWVPVFAHGYVKDLRVRWALEEAGIPYEAVLIDPQIQSSPEYRAWQPFGQVPAYKDDEVTLFESGAILLHLAAASSALSPQDVAGKARTAAWVIAALNSIEPHAQNLIHLGGSGSDASGAALRMQFEARLSGRLEALSTWLGTKDYLEGRFTAGDLIMTTVLRELVECGVLLRFPNLDALRRRCEARPAFGRALDAQLRTFRDNAPA